MATAGEAASLFGAADSANDPFALPPPEEPQPTGNDPFANVQPTAEAADLFGYAASQETAQIPQQGYAASYAAGGNSTNWNGSSAHQAAPSSSQDPYAYAPQNTYAAQPATNGWNETHSQWSGYDAQQQYGSVNGSYTNGSYAQNAPTNDPYAPPANYASTPSKVVSPSTAQSSTYASYTPSANRYNAYTPASTSQTASYAPSYDPYKPSQAASTQHVGQPSSTYAQFVNGSVEPVAQPEAPARNAAAAAQYRPKTFNAYDPPLPPPKAAPKRSAAWQSPVTSPAQVAYSSLPNSPPVRSAQSPALPPPPRKASVPPPPPRTGSAARQYTGSPGPPPLPHTQTSYGAQYPPPLNATSPPPRTGSAARQVAAPPLPPAPYHPPQAAAYQPAAPAHQSPPPPSSYQASPLPSAYQSSSPPSSYQSPPPPSSYQSPPPSSAYQSHQPPVQIPDSQATVTPPATQDPYSPVQTGYLAHEPSAGLREDEAHSGDIHDHSQAVEEVGSPSAVNPPSEAPFDPEGDITNDKTADSLSEQHPITPDAPAPENHPSPPSAEPESVIGGEYDPEGGVVEDEVHTVDVAASDAEAYAPQVPETQPVAAVPPAQPTESVYDPYRPTAATPAAPAYGNAATNVYSPPAPSAYSPPQGAEPNRTAFVSSPPTRSSTGSYGPPSHSYEPTASTSIPRTSSPSSFSVRSTKSTHSVHDPYAPPLASTTAPGARYRSMSNSSMLSTGSVQDDPYAPAQHSRQQSTDSYSYSVTRPSPSFADDSSLVTPTTSSHTQVVTLTAPTRSQYAPSPSLLGSNDPLGRTSVRVPVFTFGFGGKIVTCFHGSEMLQTGFDVAMSSKASTSLRIRPLSSIIPQSAIETSTATYPGPLFSDPGTPTTTLVRPGAAAHAKAKKAKVVKYLEERAEEITQGLGYLHQGSVELYRAEAKRALINLVKVMVENDGKLSGSPQIEAAVRAVLVPSTESASESSEPVTAGVRSAFELTSSSYGSLSSLAYDSKGVKLADHPLWSSQLDKIEALLVRGDRRGAFHYAADEKLWAHAMVIASSIDKEAWKEVVTEFVRSELSGAPAAGASNTVPGKAPPADRREPLRVAYSLFAGQGSGSVQELHPPKALGTVSQSLSTVQPTFSSTPLSAGFPQAVQPVELSKDVLVKWPTTAAMMIGSPLTIESSAALTALGDHLAFNGWYEAAHVCYLLSPQTSPVGGVGIPGGRVVLYGSPSPAKVPAVCKDPDAVIFSEIVEYALSLATPSKGQEPFSGLPHLQPYRLLRATYLAELGHIGLAKRYCEAISSSIGRPSPYLNLTFLEQLKDLTDRLIAAPMVDKSGSWIGSKMAKPSLDKIGNWLEGRFTSFIAGEGDSPNPAQNSSKVPTFSGPFAHYSSISSATNSAMPSPHMSSTNLAEMQTQAQPAPPPFRTGSAMALRTSTTSPAQIARASSAIDYLRRKPSPVPRVSSAGLSSTSTLSTPLQAPYGYPNGFSTAGTDLSTPTVQEDAAERSAGPQIASWWGAGESESATPTATTFAHPDESLQPSSSEGFISLIDTPGFSGPSSTTQAQFTAAAQAQSIGQDALDDEDDLGLGNSSSHKKPSLEGSAEPEKKEAAPGPAAEKPKEAEKPAASGGGWLSRLWKRSDSSGPVKANLGEENTFYYDAEQKRWVNKNAPPEAAKPTPPPPPPARAQTASPGMASARGPPPASPLPHPPPARPATAIDLTDGPPKKPPMRIRSNLAPPDGSSTPATPASAPPPPRTPNTMMDGPPGLDAPPTPGARRAPAKRNARNRYVDVFQQ